MRPSWHERASPGIRRLFEQHAVDLFLAILISVFYLSHLFAKVNFLDIVGFFFGCRIMGQGEVRALLDLEDVATLLKSFKAELELSVHDTASAILESP